MQRLHLKCEICRPAICEYLRRADIGRFFSAPGSVAGTSTAPVPMRLVMMGTDAPKTGNCWPDPDRR